MTGRDLEDIIEALVVTYPVLHSRQSALNRPLPIATGQSWLGTQNEIVDLNDHRSVDHRFASALITLLCVLIIRFAVSTTFRFPAGPDRSIDAGALLPVRVTCGGALLILDLSIMIFITFQ
jgi:hypothetical protein